MSEQNCRYCGGTLEKQQVPRLQRSEGRWFLIENVPALVCRQCGEQYFSPESHDLVIDLIRGNHEPSRTEIVPVYDAEQFP
jgi:YgiT-type zinc finger domain-containing protein